MEPSDWAVSSVVFIVAVAVAIAVSPTLLPEQPPELVESQLKDILESVSDEIQVQSLILKTDCNMDLYDCNRDYPVEIDINQARHNLLSQAFTLDKNKVYSVMPLGAITKLYTFPKQKITPSHSTEAFVLSSTATSEHINVHNQYLDANITDWNAIIDFLDSNEQDLVIAYPRISMSRLKDTSTSVVVGNDSNKFYLRFFPNSPEFWVDVPDDINVSFKPMQQNWKFDENIGVFNIGAWWDDDNTDAYWWHYRIPITVHSMDYAREDLNVQIDINFALQRERLGITGLIVDPNSFRLVEYKNYLAYDATTATNDNSLALSNQPFEVDFNTTTEIARVKWTLTGFTPANSSRVYYLYFDFNTYPKDTYVYSTIEYVPPENPVYITVAFPQTIGETHVFDANKAFLYNPNTLLISTVNQLSRTWQYITVGYRKPLLFSSGYYDRNALMVSTDINFALEFIGLGCAGCDLNTTSLSFVEVNNWNEGRVIKIYTYSDQNGVDTYNYSYNTNTKMMSLAWSVPATPALTKRYYFLYYDKLS